MFLVWWRSVRLSFTGRPALCIKTGRYQLTCGDRPLYPAYAAHPSAADGWYRPDGSWKAASLMVYWPSSSCSSPRHRQPSGVTADAGRLSVVVVPFQPRAFCTEDGSAMPTASRQLDGQLPGAQGAASPWLPCLRAGARRFARTPGRPPPQHLLDILRRHRARPFRIEGQHNQHPPLQRAVGAPESLFVRLPARWLSGGAGDRVYRLLSLLWR